MEFWILGVMAAGVVGAYVVTWASSAVADSLVARRLADEWFDYDAEPGEPRALIWEQTMRDELLRQASERRSWL